jgi:hypothetical protein
MSNRIGKNPKLLCGWLLLLLNWRGLHQRFNYKNVLSSFGLAVVLIAFDLLVADDFQLIMTVITEHFPAGCLNTTVTVHMSLRADSNHRNPSLLDMLVS